MAVHVNDIGTQVSQGVSDTNVLGATVSLRVQRPDASTSTIVGSAPAAGRVEAVVGAGVWTLPGTYRLQFQITLGAASFALAERTVQVQPRL